jgi:glutamyl-tRNA reductase
MHRIGVLCLSHKTCNVQELEVASDRLNPEIFVADSCMDGYAVIKTCNRVEAYITAESPRAILQDVVNQLNLKKSAIFVGEDAVKHLMRVSCGLEAMIVGEDQILGQVRKCYHDSRKAGKTDFILDMMFERAIKVAKRARSETSINEGSVSIGSAAVELAESVSGDLNGKRLLVIGAGDMGTIVAKSIREKALKAMFIANRTYEKAKKLSEELGCDAVKLSEKEKHLASCDIAICTTSAPHYILDYTSMARVMALRKSGNELIIIDIANPKDVEERVGELEGIKLYCLDNLYELSEENLKRRLSEVGKVERIIEDEMENFQYMLNRQNAEILISMLYKHGHQIREEEKTRASRYLELGRDQNEVLERFSNAILAKTLHTTAKLLRNCTDVNFINTFTVQLEREFARQGRTYANESKKLQKNESDDALNRGCA